MIKKFGCMHPSSLISTLFHLSEKNNFQTCYSKFIKLFSCSTQLNTKFIIGIVGILAIITMTNTPSESLKPRKILNFQHFSFDEQLKFHAHKKSLITSESDLFVITVPSVSLSSACSPTPTGDPTADSVSDSP